MTNEVRKILVTGAGSGLGLRFSIELAKRGHRVIGAVHLHSQMNCLEEAAKEAGVTVSVIKADITDPVDRAYLARHDVDILVNNAGIGEGGALADMPMPVLRRQFEVNYFATMEVSHPFIRRFAKRKRGRIVFISSIAGIITGPFTGAYCASKHALETSARSLRNELKDLGVSVACINPGPYETGFNDRMVEAHKNWYCPEESLVSHEDLEFTKPQIDPDRDISEMVDVILDDHSKARNVSPKEIIPEIRKMQDKEWD